MIDSPCIKVCTLDASGQLCLGCFRTLEEIGSWPTYSDPERWNVLERLSARRSAHESGRGAANSRCERCGSAFRCGASDDQACWCASYPPVPPSGPAAQCLCPACLASASGS